ncbi:hypothetical protein NFI96_029689, partial [Prochilodus magdalenae]
VERSSDQAGLLLEMEERLNAPRDFIRAAGVTRPSSPALLTPSHFTVPSVPTPAAPLPLPPAPASSAAGWGRTQAPDPWVIITQTQQELLELRRENQRLQQHRDPPSPERLRGEKEELRLQVDRLREELRERERNISRLCAEREGLCAEREGLCAELARCKGELNQIREEVCERHSAEISALTHTSAHLQETLTAATQEVTSLRQHVEEVTSERDKLQEQLRAQSGVVAEQADTLQKLRSYIGTHSGEEEQHTLVQKLQKEKEALCVSVELLKVRVQAANDILAVQERELRDQVTTHTHTHDLVLSLFLGYSLWVSLSLSLS